MNVVSPRMLFLGALRNLYRVTTATRSIHTPWPCCDQVIFLFQAHVTSQSYRWLRGRERESRPTQMFCKPRVAWSPMSVRLQITKAAVLYAHAYIPWLLAVVFSCLGGGVSNADYIQKCMRQIFKTLLFQSLVHTRDFLIFFFNKKHNLVIL